MSVQPSQFGAFFLAVNEFDPFPWQQRLARRVTGLDTVAANPWPECIALPTAGGKTACIEIAVFALACQATLPAAQRTAPRRILFVVDRRVIVDEAFDHALELAEKLDQAKSGVMKDVADSLRQVAGHAGFAEFNPDLADTPPLTCHQLRGGMYRDNAWARTPTQPCVISSTVDQIGSRLLFRGYGTGFKSWPAHGGLAGNDSLIILDEAHCSQPFFETMRWITRYRGPDWAKSPITTPFAFTIMSATPPQGIASDRVFRLGDADRKEALPNGKPNELARRVRASKPAKLVVAEKAKGKQALAELASALALEAAGFAASGYRRIAVLVNRVETARRVAELLDGVRRMIGRSEGAGKHNRDVAKAFKGVSNFDVELLTGRMRPIDRDDRLNGWQPAVDGLAIADAVRDGTRGLLKWLGTSRDRPAVPRPVFVVATQCLEVGANLDFEALVTECASLDALRQRFGRLNRIARTDQSAPATIVVRQDQAPGASNADDPVYGTTLSATWEWLNSVALPSSELGLPIVDFGIAAMDSQIERLDDEKRQSIILQGAHAPVMLPAYVDCWAQTAPEPKPSPDVALFLHGLKRGAPEIQVCWRADLVEREPQDEGDFDRAEENAIAAVAMSPPTTLECLSVPLHVFKKWWHRDADAGSDLSDASTIVAEESPTVLSSKRLALIWSGPKESKRLKDTSQLLPGDTVVLPVVAGGWETFGHIPTGSVIDVADRCHLLARRRAALRLHPELLNNWPEFGGAIPAIKSELVELLRSDEEPDDRDVHNVLVRVRDELAPMRDDLPATVRWLVESLALLQGPRSRSTRWSRCRSSIPDGTAPQRQSVWEIGLRGKRRWNGPHADEIHLRLTLGETENHEDDDSSDSAPTTLMEHSNGVASHARHFAEVCGLPAGLVDAFGLTGKLHDIGKADRRFQAFLFGGNLLLAAASDKLFAKSAGLRDTRVNDSRAAHESLLPVGFRHELVSLGLIENSDRLSQELEQLDGEQRDLVLHLVTAHHGHGRPFAPIVLDSLLLRPMNSEGEDLLAIDIESAGWPVNVSPSERREWAPPHRLDSGIPERFWRLVRRYGWWGLAWLESLFILADHRQSELEADRLGQQERETTETVR